MNIERWLDRAAALRDALSLAWNDPYLLYRFRRYKRRLVSIAWARANAYVARVPTYHDMAEGWRARTLERMHAARSAAYDHEATRDDNAQRLHEHWLKGERNIPVFEDKPK